MPGITDLDELLASMSPKLVDGDFVFRTVGGVLSRPYFRTNRKGADGIDGVKRVQSSNVGNLENTHDQPA